MLVLYESLSVLASLPELISRKVSHAKAPGTQRKRSDHSLVVEFDLMKETDLRWYAVYTKARHEKTAAELLWQKDIECFLPLREVLSRWKDRRKRVQFPLFPGYLFVNVPMKERRLDIVKVPSVVRIIGSNNGPEPIPDEQIQSLKHFVFAEIPLNPYPYLKEGDEVRIIRGSLKGLRGILVEKKSNFRFVLSVDLIQQSVSCEIDAEDCEKV